MSDVNMLYFLWMFVIYPLHESYSTSTHARYCELLQCSDWMNEAALLSNHYHQATNDTPVLSTVLFNKRGQTRQLHTSLTFDFFNCCMQMQVESRVLLSCWLRAQQRTDNLQQAASDDSGGGENDTNCRRGELQVDRSLARAALSNTVSLVYNSHTAKARSLYLCLRWWYQVILYGENRRRQKTTTTTFSTLTDWSHR